MLKYQIIMRKNPRTNQIQYHAQLLPVSPVDIKTLSAAISRECTVTIHDIKAVLSALQEKVIEYLRNGMSVRLGDLGSFHPRLACKGAPSAEEFNASYIQGVKVRFLKSGELLHGFSLQNPDLRIVRAGSPEAAAEEEEQQTA